MKKNFITLSIAAIAAFFTVSCSDDATIDGIGNNDNSEKMTTRASAAKCWTICDGNFLTAGDVVLSSDEAHVEISKVLLKRTDDKSEMMKGDVIGLYMGGNLTYLEVTDLKDNGLFMSIDVNKIDLEKTLDLCQINMNNIRLSTDIYVDPNQPKRVNNSGNAEPAGVINAERFVEHAADGTTIYHPDAITYQAHYEGMNADDEASLVQDGFVGCYVGLADSETEANGLGDFLKKLGSEVSNVFIKPVKEVADKAVGVATETAKLIKAVAVGGKYGFNADAIVIDQEFDDKTIYLEFDPNGEDCSKVDPQKGLWTKEGWGKSAKGKMEINLNGHATAKAGAYMDLTFKPGRVEKFVTGVHAISDMKLDTRVVLGCVATASYPKVIKRFELKKIKFQIGPVPVIITIFPELVFKTSLTGSGSAFVDFHLENKVNYDACIQVYPTFDATNKSEKPSFDCSFQRAGFNGNLTFKTGLYFRTSWELYGLTGPQFDLGAGFKAEAAGEFFVSNKLLNYNKPNNQSKNTDKDSNRLKRKDIATGHVRADFFVGSTDISYVVKFPPLAKYSEWLYNKLSWDSGSLISIPPLFTYNIFNRGDVAQKESGLINKLWDKINDAPADDNNKE